uniref:Variant surface glycoprotein 1125.2862 n=1 Tax=Trypanosoma brucei TaxID=5691 RepID=A0A1J0R8Z7_9TRYP|nr:variant surface glycoprotein 1125.2862 [Trypanosoma brucei]
MQTLLTKATALGNELKQLTLAAAKYAGTPKHDLYLLLMVLAKRRKQEADNKISENTPKLTKLVKEINRRRGALENRLGANGKQTTHYTKAASDGSTTELASSFSKKWKITASLTTTAVEPCEIQAEAATKIANAARKVRSTGQLQLATEAQLKQTILEVYVQVKGNGGANQAAVSNQACGDNGTPTNGQGITIPTLTTPSYAKQAIDLKHQGSCKPATPDDHKQHLETKPLIYSVCDIQDSDLTSTSTLSETTVDQVAAGTDVQDTAMQITGEIPTKSGQKKRTDIVKRLIGVSDGTVGEKNFKN